MIDRSVDRNGVLKSHRLMSTAWGIPEWAVKLTGASGSCYISEHSEVDPTNKTLTLKSRNVTISNIISVEEKLVYAPHPTDTTKTLLKQEAAITVKGLPLTSYMEGILERNMSANAGKGRQAMEWVISCIKNEAADLKQAALKGMDSAVSSVDSMMNSSKPTSL